MISARIALLGLLCLAVGAPDGSNSIDVVGFISHLGFPVFVSLWFMHRIEKRMDRLITSQENLTTVVTVLTKTIDNNIPVRKLSKPREPREG